MMACIALLLASCQQEQIVFDHEQQQFATLENAILIELIAPIGTSVDEEIYIIGAFNGMDEKAVIGNVAWQLEKAELSDKKWGIYLFPTDFVDGKTLADGFSFVSKKSGLEYTIKGEPATHSLTANVGQMYNVWADRWASYFASDGEQVQHDGPVVYVLDESGFGQLNLYMWGDVNDLNGGWPGMAVTGTEKIGDYTYMYFDMGAANAGLNENLIFSNNGSSQLADYAYTIGENIYLYLTSEGAQLIADPANPGDVVWFDPQAKPKEEATLDIWIYNATNTLSPLHVYAWGSKEVFGAWPGTAINSMDSAAILNLPLSHTQITGFVGDEYHLIFNNNAGTQLADYDIKVEAVTNELYIKVSDEGVTPLSIAAQIQGKR